MDIDDNLKNKIIKWQDKFNEVVEDDEIDPDFAIDALWLLDSVASLLRGKTN